MIWSWWGRPSHLPSPSLNTAPCHPSQPPAAAAAVCGEQRRSNGAVGFEGTQRTWQWKTAKGGSSKDGIWRLWQRVAMAGGGVWRRQWTMGKAVAVTYEHKTAKGGGGEDGVWRLQQQAVIDGSDGQWGRRQQWQMKMMFDGSDGRVHSMVEVAFNGLYNRQQGCRGEERRINATIKSR